MLACTATGLIAAYMRLCGFHGWASFWRTAYVLPRHEDSQRLLRHERCHLEQIERDRRVMFSVKYLWWLCRYGYRQNPCEAKAREAESKPRATRHTRFGGFFYACSAI